MTNITYRIISPHFAAAFALALRNYRHLPRRPQIMMSARSTSLSHGLALRLREPSPARAT